MACHFRFTSEASQPRTQEDIGALGERQRCMQIMCSGNWKLKCITTDTNAGKERIEMENA